MFLSHTVLYGRFVNRLALGNLATQWEDVMEAWQEIVKASRIGISGHRDIGASKDKI